jgi:hypothetical protein
MGQGAGAKDLIEEVRTCLTIIRGHVELSGPSEVDLAETKRVVEEAVLRAVQAVEALAALIR